MIASFDFAISEYGASIWCDPQRWIAEASRILRPGGRLVFLVNSTLMMLAMPELETESATASLRRPQRAMHRFEWPDSAGVDNDIAGVAATGDGDVMMRFALAFAAVEAMRAGVDPDEACARSLARVEAKHYRVQACLVALRKDGAFGAAKIGEPPFSYAVKSARIDEVRRT